VRTESIPRAAAGVAVAATALSWAAAQAPAALTDPIPQKIQESPVSIRLNPIASGVGTPVDLQDAGDGSGRLFVTDQSGTVRIIRNGQLQSTPFLDVKSQLVGLQTGYDERGLLGVAFDPDFKTNGKLYTYYTAPPTSATADKPDPFLASPSEADHQGVLSEWHVDPNNPDRVDTSSRRELLRWDHPNFNHNGGHIAFGPDKMLYVSVGDGGGADDQNGQEAGPGNTTRGKAPEGNGQNNTVIMGKILRIDPNGTNSSNGKYGIPADNPFAGQSDKAQEIYATGFRNPYRFSFDKATGRLIANDVGQISVEEVDVVTKGGNYGWHVKEGSFLFDPLDTTKQGVVTANSPGSPAGLIDPVAQYDHDEGEATIGGFVYHGTKIPQLQGKYVFGDLSRDEDAPEGRLFVTDLNGGPIQELNVRANRSFDFFVKGFGEDANGELFVLASSEIGLGGTGVVFGLDAGNATSVPLPLGLWTGLSAFAGVVYYTARCRRPASPA
jgi:glucose/arabinose dehydrogenase